MSQKSKNRCRVEKGGGVTRPSTNTLRGRASKEGAATFLRKAQATVISQRAGASSSRKRDETIGIANTYIQTRSKHCKTPNGREYLLQTKGEESREQRLGGRPQGPGSCHHVKNANSLPIQGRGGKAEVEGVWEKDAGRKSRKNDKKSKVGRRRRKFADSQAGRK